MRAWTETSSYFSFALQNMRVDSCNSLGVHFDVGEWKSTLPYLGSPARFASVNK